MSWKLRFLMVTLLGAMLSVGLLGSAALASQSSSPATHGANDYSQGRLIALVDELVQENVITQDQADVILERAASQFTGPRGIGHASPRPFGKPFVLKKSAEELGLTLEELRDILVEGGTIAEIAEPQGVSLDDLISALTAGVEARLSEAVADGTLTQAEADKHLERIRDVTTKLVTHEGKPALGSGPHAGKHRQYAQGHHRPRQTVDKIAAHLRGTIGAVTELLGLEPKDILTQIREGSTVAEIAESQGVSLDELVGTLIADVEAKLSEAVASGKLTQAEADEHLERATEMVTKLVSNSLPMMHKTLR